MELLQDANILVGQKGEPPLYTTRKQLRVQIFPQSHRAANTKHLNSFGLEQGFDPPPLAFPKSSCGYTFKYLPNNIHMRMYYFPITSHLTFPVDIILATELSSRNVWLPLHCQAFLCDSKL